MEIIYKDTKIFSEEELQRLFLSVKWESGNYPKKLVNAMRNSTHVISAWDNECLVDDGETVAFIHYLLVDPKYQGLHIGEIPFYERYGFKQYENYSAMVIKNFN
ncbi:MAG: N-acetyltransferase [Lachnospiraceae bacterium]|nr:N-acetyltransferase [Lachnospiraceae bacterium]